ncbi:alanine racemase [Roseivivax isoporae]|uniref:Alanine racemase n=1 Tax=Roseivivax isoporae LMG 25204 TaxID=1449351 RepID=X7F8A2_9RHOB|nr:alanine racemase [Roseivivax isoporae]ETX28314.1 alanine racemase [Roseivivax isoporae LMG 25204]
MATALLTVDLDALALNWTNLDRAGGGAETGAVVKADAYGLGVAQVAPALARAGARRFFVALAEEGIALRDALGQGPEIFVFNGHMPGDAATIRDAGLVPLVNSIDQMVMHVEALPGHPFGIQLDSGMNRLGMEPAEWAALREIALAQNPRLVMSHLACADEPDHPMNRVQLDAFREMTDGIEAPRSLSATGGILLGAAYHFDVTRPGVGLYGGLPFVDAQPVAHVDLPVIQVRDVAPGETVGYGNTWTAGRPTRVATVAGGYADGIHRIMGPHAYLYAGETRCPIVGRISMDLIGVDVTDAPEVPATLEFLGRHQSVDTVADAAGTIGYEVLTALGPRYARRYTGG